MGQAKDRGTYEQRKETAIEDNKKTIQLLVDQEEGWWNSLSEKEKQAVTNNRMRRLSQLAIASNLAGRTI